MIDVATYLQEWKKSSYGKGIGIHIVCEQRMSTQEARPFPETLLVARLEEVIVLLRAKVPVGLHEWREVCVDTEWQYQLLVCVNENLPPEPES